MENQTEDSHQQINFATLFKTKDLFYGQKEIISESIFL